MDIVKRIKRLIGKKYFIPVVLAAAAIIAILSSHRNSSGGDAARALPAITSDELEQKIEDLCLSVEGIKSAKVLLTLDTSEEYVLAKDTEKSGDSVKITNVITDSGGVGLYAVAPKIRGVAVVCTGGDRASVKVTVTDLICAALGIDSSKVSVAGG